jgi:hypothetical protein
MNSPHYYISREVRFPRPRAWINTGWYAACFLFDL